MTIACVIVFVGFKLRAHPERALALYTLAFCLALAAFLRPAALHPFNRMWMKVGDHLARFTNPLLMGIFFALVITPFGLLRRAFGHGTIHSGFDPDRETYWVPRAETSVERDSLSRQF